MSDCGSAPPGLCEAASTTPDAMRDNSLIDLLDCVADVIDHATGETFLHAVKKIYGVQNIAYLCNQLPKPTHQGYYVHHSYGDAWAKHYEAEQLIFVDPVVRAGLNSILPTDWSCLPDLTSPQRRFLNEAQEFGIGRQGLTVSVRGLKRETALFSINTDLRGSDWARYKLEYMRDIQIIATFFHQRVAYSPNQLLEEMVGQLTPRELECLKWCAAGKTFADIGEILEITERTVHFHLTLCRHKLNALTNPQAVGRAIQIGLIVPG